MGGRIEISPVMRKVLIWCGIVLGTLLLLTLIALWMTFSGYRDFPEPKLDERHYLFLRRLATDMRNNRDLGEAELRFAPEDMDLLLDIVRHASQFAPGRSKKLPPPKNFMLKYDRNNGVYGAAPIPVAGEWLFGGKIYVSGALRLEKEEKKLNAEVKKLGFGRFDLPLPFGVDTFVPDWRQKLEKAFSGEIMSAVKSIRTESDGTVVLVYRPQDLRKPLKKRLTQLEERCSGELKLPIRQLINAL